MNTSSIFTNDELALKDLLSRGDTGAIASLFETYYALLLNYSCKFLPQPEAEDIVQDVFVELQTKAGQIQIKQSIKSYLFRAVHNRCVDHIRHSAVQRRYANYVLIDLSLRELAYFDPEKGNRSLLLNEKMETVDEAIAQLPPKCREILKLKYQQELETREIAELLNISSRTVETQLYKAVKRLRGVVKKLSYLFFSLLVILSKID